MLRSFVQTNAKSYIYHTSRVGLRRLAPRVPEVMETVKSEQMTTRGQNANSLLFATRAFAKAIEKLAAECWLPSGLKANEANLLMNIISDSPVTVPFSISWDFKVNPSTVTRLVDKLVAKGMVTRQWMGNWGGLKPTPKALALLPELEKCKLDFLDRCDQLFAKGRAHTLAASLNGISGTIFASLRKPKVKSPSNDPQTI